MKRKKCIRITLLPPLQKPSHDLILRLTPSEMGSLQLEDHRERKPTTPIDKWIIVEGNKYKKFQPPILWIGIERLNLILQRFTSQLQNKIKMKNSE